LKSGRGILFFGALGGLLYGFDQGVISGVLLFIQNDIPMSSFMEGVVVSSLLLGAVFGAAGAGGLADKIGRRKSIAIIAILFIVGSIGSAYAPEVYTLIVARVINGLGVGGSMAIVPVYLSELAPTRMRGTVTALYQLALTSGIVFAYLSNHLLAPFEAWREMLLVSALPGVLILIGIFFMPESPRWLLRNEQEIKAREVMAIFRKPSELEKEIEDIKQIEATDNETSFTTIKSKWIRPMLIIAISVAVFQQIVGINAVIYYAPSIFVEAGLENTASTLGTLGIGIMNVLMTIVAILTVDKLGRRNLLKTGSIAMAVSLLALSFMLMAFDLSGGLAWVTVILTAVYVMSFAFSWGAVTWVIIPELLPLKARGAGTGIAIMAMSAANLVVTLIFPVLLDYLGITWIFIIFAVFSILSFVFVTLFLPETKERSLEDIEKELRHKAITA